MEIPLLVMKVDQGLAQSDNYARKRKLFVHMSLTLGCYDLSNLLVKAPGALHACSPTAVEMSEMSERAAHRKRCSPITRSKVELEERLITT